MIEKKQLNIYLRWMELDRSVSGRVVRDNDSIDNR